MMNNNLPPVTETEYILSLYVTGMSPGSLKAIENLKSICEKYLRGNTT
jgi:circadian clock protein KaiB